MHKPRTKALSAIAAVVALAAPLIATPGAQAAALPVHRLYSTALGDHLFTTNPVEYQNLRKAGWRDEGIAFQSSADGKPAYRLYGNGRHLFTPSIGERDILLRAGWRDEGIAFNYPDGGATVWRVYNPANGDHMITASLGERNALVSAGWNYEGVSFGVADDSWSTLPVYKSIRTGASCNAVDLAGCQRLTDSLRHTDLWLDDTWDKGTSDPADDVHVYGHHRYAGSDWLDNAASKTNAIVLVNGRRYRITGEERDKATQFVNYGTWLSTCKYYGSEQFDHDVRIEPVA